jgi:hypothetical protein
MAAIRREVSSRNVPLTIVDENLENVRRIHFGVSESGNHIKVAVTI